MLNFLKQYIIIYLNFIKNKGPIFAKDFRYFMPYNSLLLMFCWKDGGLRPFLNISVVYGIIKTKENIEMHELLRGKSDNTAENAGTCVSSFE